MDLIKAYQLIAKIVFMLPVIHTTPIDCIQLANIKFFIKKDYLNHSYIQGNKLHKLKYNIDYAIKNNCSHLVTFGGAYSNHIAATAYAAKRSDIPSIAFIRGEELKENPKKWSKTLHQANENNMHFYFISRSEYRLKENSTVFKAYTKKLNKPHFIPEGGSNQLGIKGAAELIDEIKQQLPTMPTHILCACGTGGTLAGLIEGAAKHKLKTKIMGINVHQASKQIEKNIKILATHQFGVDWQLFDKYHHGGYAKITPELSDFATQFTKTSEIPLDRIYNSKSFFALNDLARKGFFDKNDRPLIIHTGGLQGGVF